MSANDLSLSSRRAWIEIWPSTTAPPSHWSLSSRRAWIEIRQGAGRGSDRMGRSPHGERGLK